jgi:dipeptidyl-peptidase-4
MRVEYRRARFGAWLALACVLVPLMAEGQSRRLTIADIFDPDRRIDATGTVPSRISWIDDQQYTWTRRTEDGFEWFRTDARTGTSVPLYDVSALEATWRRLGLDADVARRAARPGSPAFDPQKRGFIITALGDLFQYEFASGVLIRLTNDPALEQDPEISPDGRLVAFTRAHDLFVVDLGTQRERRLTTDGSADRLNGRLDYVYQEEIYGRDHYRGFWWSPDSRRLAFVQLDENGVPRATLRDYGNGEEPVHVFHYPRPGTPNPQARLGVVLAEGGAVRWVNVPSRDRLIVSVAWREDGAELTVQVQDRAQTWLDLYTADPTRGTVSRVLHETTAAWVDRHADPLWLADGTFLWLSERDGWKHAYRHRRDGTLVARVTAGQWEVRQTVGVDEPGGWVYFLAAERSATGVDLYRVRLDGTGLVRLSGPGGTHAATFNPSFSLYVGTWSDATTPVQTRLHDATGREVRLIDRNSLSALAEFRLSPPEFLQVRTRDGFAMEALLIKPPDFDPSRRYPVYQHTYGGPGSPEVENKWGGTTYLFHQLLAQHGIVVWICDNRTASGKGAASAWPAYTRLGETELADIEDGLTWLTQQPWVDASRIGINGWSYGGFVVSYAMTHSRRFTMGIAGGPVTDWRDYDSIYTERYMRLPEDNPEGYARSAPREAAASLHGRLLLLHGTMDDNVHLEHTLLFAQALQRAGKEFDLMLYPSQRHGLTDARQTTHLRSTMLAFILRTLEPDGAASATSRAVRAEEKVW